MRPAGGLAPVATWNAGRELRWAIQRPTLDRLRNANREGQAALEDRAKRHIGDSEPVEREKFVAAQIGFGDR